jgi:predicted MFS family arabinose efflux permease
VPLRWSAPDAQQTNASAECSVRVFPGTYVKGSAVKRAAQLSESKILLLLGAVQFVNVLDFVMVMPLGPDFAQALDIPTAHLGLVSGAYTAAACLAGLLGASLLDRFDRRWALVVTLLGLVIGTALGGVAVGLWSMVATRIVAGTFGGPATSLALSILADVVPVERRGRAMGKVMGAFSVASVLGIPAGLELARLGGWQAPFYTVAAMGVAVAIGVVYWLPPMRAHLSEHKDTPSKPLSSFLRDRLFLASFSCSALAMIGAFAVIANLSSFVQFNLGYPREQLGILYMVGGTLAFFSMRVAGTWVDRLGSTQVVTIGTGLLVLVLGLSFVPEPPWMPVVVIFAGFMVANSTRLVALNALTSRVPRPQDRARFMSLQSAVQHLSTSAGAAGSSWILREGVGGRLEGMPTLALFAIGLSLVLPILVYGLAKRLA